MKRFLPLLLLTLSFYTALADNFIVTSNADAGPGSLREAITLAAANGSTTPDLISFNFAATDVNSRTISVLSELPALSSNLVIDASTQPGTAFGISNAKVVLYFNKPAPPANGIFFTAFNAVNMQDIEIYGLYFKGFVSSGIAVYCDNSKNIKVGAPGKGNLFTGWLTAIGYPDGFGIPYKECVGIYVQSNIIGLMEDGNSTTYGLGPTPSWDACCSFGVDFKSVRDLKIGGSLPGEGNIINYIVSAAFFNKDANSPPSNFYIIENNIIGMNASGTVCATTSTPNFPAIELHGTSGVIIKGNHIGGIGRVGGIYLTDLTDLTIQSNLINVDKDGNQCASSFFQGIYLISCYKGLIGGNGPSDKNTVAYTTNLSGIYLVNSYSITVSKNSTYCNQQWGSIEVGGWRPSPTVGDEPFITVNGSNAGSISGKALPNSIIELFIDDDCALCEGKTYVTSVQADQNGNWSYTGTDAAKLVATATAPLGSTSNFGGAMLDQSKIPVVKPATCGLNNGTVTNIAILSGTTWHWEDENGTTVGTDTTLKGVPAGKYRMVIGIGGAFCGYKTDYFTVTEMQLPPTVSPSIIPASCGSSNGSITVNYNNTDYSGQWLNAAQQTIGTGFTLSNIPPGNYFLKLSTNVDASCYQLFGPFQVINQSGPALDITNMAITNSFCNASNGQIKGIKATNTTGNIFTRWLDENNNPVGSNFDLQNVKPGKYRLKFKDASTCDTILSPFYTIPNLGFVTMDETNKVITASNCNSATGSITQIKVTGADTYKWINGSNGNVASTSVDLINGAPGVYLLQIDDQYGCRKESSIITIPAANFSAINIITKEVTDALCAQPKGSIKITSFDKDASAYTFKWIDNATGATIGTGTSITSLAAGSYKLLAKDNNNCENVIYTASIVSKPVPTFDYNAVQQVNDDCNQLKATIAGIKVNGLVGPTTYNWQDASNATVGNAINLQNAGKGTYTLTVTDAGVCTIQSKPFTISNDDNAIAAPAYSDLTIARYSSAGLNIKNAANGSYILSANATGSPIAQQNNSGNFILQSVASVTNVYVQRIMGTCKSPVTKVFIKVVDKSGFAVPTAFTPNGDGKNDRLSVKVVGYIELNYFRIFDRFGTLIYETHQVNDGWDGYLKGVLQSAGAYVWIAQGKDINGKIVSDKGSFVLIK